MRVVKNIESAKYYINKMAADLDLIKNENKKRFNTDALNSFIVLINSLENLLNFKYKINVVESLILARIYSQLAASALEDGKIDIKRIVHNIDQDVCNTSKWQKERIVGLLRGDEVTALVDAGRLTADNLDRVTSNDEWQKLIDNLLIEIKQQIIWN